MSYRFNLMGQHWNVPSTDLQLEELEQPLAFQVHGKEFSALVSLPTEILNVIGQFLSVKDLLSCSVTCTRLRAAFNNNILWRRFCKQNVIRYLDKAKLKISEEYDISSLTCSLDLICDERLHYIKQNQLLNNWKNGKFVDHTINSSSGLYYMGLKSDKSIIYEDIYLFLYDFYEHNITIWNIEDIPFPYTNIRLLYHNYFYEGLHYEIVGKKLVVLEVGKLIQIYDINLPDKTMPLACIILVGKDEPLHEIPQFTNPEEMFSVCYHRIIDDKIYSHKVSKPILHIWDIKLGRKVKALNPPKMGSHFDILSAANNGNDLILCLEIDDEQREHNALGTIYEVLSYSFSRDFFKTVWTNKVAGSSTYIPFHAIQHQNLVVLFCRLSEYFLEDKSLPKTVLVLYDYKWRVIIGEKSFPELICHQQTKVVNNKLILATAFCVYLMDIYSQEIEYSFKYDSGKIELLNVFDGDFIITTPKSLSKTKKIEVWHVKNRKRCVLVTYVSASPYSTESVFVNQSFTKLIVVGKGTVGILHFW